MSDRRPGDSGPEAQPLPLGPLGAAPGPAPGLARVRGHVHTIVHKSFDGEFVVARIMTDDPLADLVTVVGALGGVDPGDTLEVEGKLVQHERFGPQILVENWRPIVPVTSEGIVRYLSSGKIRGIGKGFAERLVGVFGEQTLDVIREGPERLREVAGVGKKRAKSLVAAVRARQKVEAIFVFLHSHGMHASFAHRVYKTYGDDALHRIKENPYRLADDIWGVGFRTADTLALALGFEKTSPHRVASGLLYALNQMTEDGHVCPPVPLVLEESARLLDIDATDIEPLFGTLTLEGRVVREARMEAGDEVERVWPKVLYERERTLARALADIARTPPQTIAKAEVEARLEAAANAVGITLADLQIEAIRAALTRRVLVVTGGPGTGKTTIVRALLAALDPDHPRVVLAAPTGRASRRLSEATGREAKTLHRALEFDPRQGKFQRGPDHPLEADLVLVDESSMMDLTLAHALVQATPVTSRLVLVGDVDQLPSVGPGAVLADVINSGVVPVVRLDRIFRQAGGSLIVQNAHRIRTGESPRTGTDADGGDDFFIIEREEAEAVAETIVKVVAEHIPRRLGVDPFEDVQVLVPMRKGAAGVEQLNRLLRDRLNPQGEHIDGTFRVGDRVMQLKNDYERDVFNGDTGRILARDAESNEIFVRFDDRDVVYDKDDLDTLALAYAVSIHKSQGSEYPAVVVPVHFQHWKMLKRNLLYTAVTRGKRFVVLVGQKKAIWKAAREVDTSVRHTLLATRLREEFGA